MGSILDETFIVPTWNAIKMESFMDDRPMNKSTDAEAKETVASTFDRFARFYDNDYRYYDDDLQCILDLAQECGDPVLEIGCGTGRALLPLAAMGHHVTGIDISPGLLDVARHKVQRADLPGTVVLHEADMRSFALDDQTFSFAFCVSNTLMHCTTQADQLAALRSIQRHLRPGGLLLIDLFNPDLPRLLAVEGVCELADQWEEETSGTQVLKWSVRRVDMSEQLQETTFIYEEIAMDGTVRRTPCPFLLRYLWRGEGELMLAAAGFQVEAVWGNFDGEPYASESDHLIFVASKPEE